MRTRESIDAEIKAHRTAICDLEKLRNAPLVVQTRFDRNITLEPYGSHEMTIKIEGDSTRIIGRDAALKIARFIDDRFPADNPAQWSPF